MHVRTVRAYKSWQRCWLCYSLLIERRPTRLLFFPLPASSAAATVGVVAAAVVVADVALTREAGKNAKLAALLEDAGISSVEVMEGRTMQRFLIPVLYSGVGI